MTVLGVVVVVAALLWVFAPTLRRRISSVGAKKALVPVLWVLAAILVAYVLAAR